MKKMYIAPEMEVVEIKTNVGILAGSVDAPLSDDTQDNGDALAPDMGVPGFFFE